MRPMSAAILGVALIASVGLAPQPPSFKTAQARISYALGVEAGQQFRTRAIDIDPRAFAQGLEDVVTGKSPRLTDDQVKAAIAELQASLKRRDFEARTAGTEAAREAGNLFLAENGKKPGVVTLPSGLQYTILRAGHGPTPTERDTVECNYRGTTLGGVEFDSSSRAASSTTVVLAQVIAGLREALTRMPVGSKWQIVVPPALASGTRAATMLVPPGEVLIYDVELLAIK
jgi:FKBP-type peptidyl-prolyl cis-trans isomerase